MKAFKFLILIVLIPPFLLSCIFLAVIMHKFDWGSVPDWFSFAANASTVIVTFYIAKNAKKFLDDKVHSEGLIRGYKILDEIDDINDRIELFVARTMNNHKVVEMASKPEENYNNYSLESAISNAFKNRDSLNEYRSRLKNVFNMTKRLQRWHIELSHQNEFNDFFSKTSELFDHLIYITGYNSEIDYPDSEYSSARVNEILPYIYVIHAEVDKSYKRILDLKFKETFKII